MSSLVDVIATIANSSCSLLRSEVETSRLDYDILMSVSLSTDKSGLPSVSILKSRPRRAELRVLRPDHAIAELFGVPKLNEGVNMRASRETSSPAGVVANDSVISESPFAVSTAATAVRDSLRARLSISVDRGSSGFRLSA